MLRLKILPFGPLSAGQPRAVAKLVAGLLGMWWRADVASSRCEMVEFRPAIRRIPRAIEGASARPITNHNGERIPARATARSR